MRAFMSLSGFAIATLVALILLSLGSVYGDVAAMLWGFAVFPHGAAYIAGHWPGHRAGGQVMDVSDRETHYWRTSDWH